MCAWPFQQPRFGTLCFIGNSHLGVPHAFSCVCRVLDRRQAFVAPPSLDCPIVLTNCRCPFGAIMVRLGAPRPRRSTRQGFLVDSASHESSVSHLGQRQRSTRNRPEHKPRRRSNTTGAAPPHAALKASEAQRQGSLQPSPQRARAGNAERAPRSCVRCGGLVLLEINTSEPPRVQLLL